MPSYGLESILDYFEQLATDHPLIQHGTAGKKGFISSDIEDFLADENHAIRGPFLIAGFNAEGIDYGRSTFTFSDTSASFQNYNFNLAVCVQAASMQQHNASREALILIDQICQDICDQIVEDRINAIDDPDNPDKCLLKYLDQTINISPALTIGAQKTICQVLNFNFNFHR